MAEVENPLEFGEGGRAYTVVNPEVLTGNPVRQERPSRGIKIAPRSFANFVLKSRIKRKEAKFAKLQGKLVDKIDQYGVGTRGHVNKEAPKMAKAARKLAEYNCEIQRLECRRAKVVAPARKAKLHGTLLEKISQCAHILESKINERLDMKARLRNESNAFRQGFRNAVVRGDAGVARATVAGFHPEYAEHVSQAQAASQTDIEERLAALESQVAQLTAQNRTLSETNETLRRENEALRTRTNPQSEPPVQREETVDADALTRENEELRRRLEGETVRANAAVERARTAERRANEAEQRAANEGRRADAAERRATEAEERKEKAIEIAVATTVKHVTDNINKGLSDAGIDFPISVENGNLIVGPVPAKAAEVGNEAPVVGGGVPKL